MASATNTFLENIIKVTTEALQTIWILYAHHHSATL